MTSQRFYKRSVRTSRQHGQGYCAKTGVLFDDLLCVRGDNFYEQIHGAAMGSPVSPFVANLYIEHFESITLSAVSRPPSLWFRYLDDTFVLTPEYEVDSLTSHINNIDDHIQLTTETETQGELSLLGLCVTVLDDASTKISL